MERSSLVPGFRFHPTDPELVMYYLKRKILGKKIIVNAVAEVNIYDFSPWDLPDKSSMRSGDLKWYFFCPKAKKYASGSRLNRATEIGFWKATGKDRTVKYKERTVATIKTLVFHLGHAGNGERTNWVMHEYKMEDKQLADQGINQDTYVLCIIFKKEGAGPKNGADYGAPFNEEEWDDDVASCSGLKSLGTTMNQVHLRKGSARSTGGLSLIEPGSSTVTSANETAKYKQKNKMVPQSTCGLSLIEPGSGLSTVTYSGNETANYKRKGPATMNQALLPISEPGSSTGLSSAKKRRMNMPEDADVMYFEDFASIMGESSEDLNGKDKNKGVEVDNTKELKNTVPNEDDGIFDDLVNLMNLDDINGDASNMFNTDETYMLNMIMGADDLDVNLGKFSVD